VTEHDEAQRTDPRDTPYCDRLYHVRWMIRRDFPEILEIEHESFEYPWNEEAFISCLQQRNCIGMVAEDGDRVLGYMVYELHKTKLAILNFAVSPSHRRQNVGLSLVAKLITKLSFERREKLSIRIRETNLDALCFFRTCGFVADALLPEFFEDTDEDAILMHYRHRQHKQRDREKPEFIIADIRNCARLGITTPRSIDAA
jgi:ribosomal-protein-alanine N-acetyltransferase